MGMTDKQFQSWVRFLLAMLKDYIAEKDPKKITSIIQQLHELAVMTEEEGSKAC